MRILCILGRHKWRVDNSDPERPFEICDRCGHYRNDVQVHWTDLTAEANMRPMDPGAAWRRDVIGGYHSSASVVGAAVVPARCAAIAVPWALLPL